MITAEHDDDRSTPANRPTRPTQPTPPTATMTPPAGIPQARQAPTITVRPLPAAPARTATPSPAATRPGAPGPAERDQALHRVITELETDALAARWALRLVLLGVAGLVVLVMFVL